jgi:hypothetical protein
MPINALEVGKAMVNRLLIVDSGSLSPPSAYAKDMESNIDSTDDWGSSAIEEVAKLYRADPVITVTPSGIKSDSNSNNYEICPSEQDKVRSMHKYLSIIISDWCNMLHDFSYI